MKRQRKSRVANENPEVSSGSPQDFRIPIWLLVLASFFTGFSVLLIEVAGPRLLAPYLGDSLYTWSTTIAVVLGAMAAGYVAGGILADRRPEPSVYFSVIFAGGLLAALIPPVARITLSEDLSRLSPAMGTLKMCLLLFAPSCFVLSMSWPFAVRLVFESGESLGRRAGIVGSASTLGSIAGAISGGWWFMPTLGIRTTFWIAAAIPLLIGAAGFVAGRKPAALRAVMVVIALAGLGLAATPEAAPAWNVIHRQHSFYHRIDVIEEEGFRYLKLNSTYEGGRDLDTGDLAFEYLKYWPLMLDAERPPRELLFLGAGAFSLPGYMAERYPEARFTVVDIDPAIQSVGKQFFGAGDIPGLVSVSEDARRFLVRSPKKYDAIFGDTYHGINRIPPHLATVEYFRLIRDRLSDSGRFLMNVIGSMEGEGARLPGGMIAALKEAFPEVRIFATRPYAGKIPQNLLVLATSRAVVLDRDPRAEHLVRREIAWDKPEPAFTDDHVPADYLAARMLDQARQ